MTPAKTLNGSANIALAAAIDIGRGPRLDGSAIEDEPRWRCKPPAVGAAPSAPRVVATRWRSLEQRPREVSHETPPDSHIVAIVLRNENVRFSVAGRTVHDGVVTPGAFHVTEPAVPTRCTFRGPYDVLHLHVPNRTIAEICDDSLDREPVPFSPQPTLARDPAIEQLGRALLAAERVGGSYGRLYADSVGIAIVTRLLALCQADTPVRSRVAELAKWRLKRATEYIEASLAESVSLGEIAAAAGLTRMHFAAQFRVATGLRPHEYLLRRRIERAQEKLAETRMSLVDIALSVGFQTQSHFTSVFTRLVGQPPRAWRQAQGDAESCDFGKGRAALEAPRPSRSYSGQLAQPC
ncbi:MAG TPA: AraC family transcriptional regulator [Stellaceae bacterium]|nr:AraC family transcriptional regulator [Stellaceae bacterium]